MLADIGLVNNGDGKLMLYIDTEHGAHVELDVSNVVGAGTLVSVANIIVEEKA